MPMADQDIKADYEKLAKKHKGLPSFEILNEEIELVSVEKWAYLSRAIRRRMNDKIIFFCRIIENIIYPNGQSQISAYEGNFFDDEEKTKLAALHKKLMAYDRESLLLDVETTEEKDIEYIKRLFSEWDEYKKQLSKIVSIMEKAWKAEHLEEQEERYFG